MNPKIGYLLAKFIGCIKGDKQKETLNKWFVKKGVKLDLNGPGWININSNIAKNEPHLISIGSNTTIAGDVEFVTHDNSISKCVDGVTDLFGKITIGRNCFIGARSTILYGISIADNVIVAAGSVVTKSIRESNIIVAGNPAKKISDWECFVKKTRHLAWNLNSVSKVEMVKKTSAGEKLISR